MKISELQELTVKFRDDRDWEQFHTGSNLAKSVCIEAAELLELFQWNEDVDKKALSEEMSDVLSYLLLLADRFEIDLANAYLNKIKKNDKKYPIEKFKGSSKKYNK